VANGFRLTGRGEHGEKKWKETGVLSRLKDGKMGDVRGAYEKRQQTHKKKYSIEKKVKRNGGCQIDALAEQLGVRGGRCSYNEI